MAVIPGTYNIAFGIEYSAGAPTPKPLYLTRNGEGKQLTVEHPTGSLNQAWNIQLPLEGGNFKIDSKDRIIIPELSESTEAFAASQGIIKPQNEVCLIKNLQVWTFIPVREEDKLYEIHSNLYSGMVGSFPLLGLDKEYKKAIIQFAPVVENPPPKPVWQLIGPINEKY